jgi:hypothetical protein
VGEFPGTTAEGVASTAGIGRSTANKALGRLAQAGEVSRFEGGRDAGRRLPDRFTLVGTELPPAYAGHTTTGSATEPDGAEQAGTANAEAGDVKPAEAPESGPAETRVTTPKSEADRLKPGQLEPLVLAYLKENAPAARTGRLPLPGRWSARAERSAIASSG